MTQDQLTGAAAILLSLLIAYIPGLNAWYSGLAKESKALLMAVLLLVVAVGSFALTCGGFVSIGVVCDKNGLVALVQLYVLALIANQSTFTLFVRPFQPK